MSKECPKCGAEMERAEAEPDVGITGGWDCFGCGHAELEEEGDDEPLPEHDRD